MRTAALVTPAMQSPHESLSLNTSRGLVAADLGNPFTYPGYIDVYNVAQDCRHPALDASLPVGVMGHEGTFSPDRRTFWVSSAGGGTLTAVDLSNASAPLPRWTTHGMNVHGLNVSDDGNTLYFADLGRDGKSSRRGGRSRGEQLAPGYAGHYCAVPQRVDPGIVACSFILSGLRVIDVRDPYHPKEVAYFNAPVRPSSTGGPGSNYAMCAPAFDPQHGQIWYADGIEGFFAVKVTNGVWPFSAA